MEGKYYPAHKKDIRLESRYPEKKTTQPNTKHKRTLSGPLRGNHIIRIKIHTWVDERNQNPSIQITYTTLNQRTRKSFINLVVTAILLEVIHI